MAFHLTPEQQEYLRQLSTAEDTAAAREMCKTFLDMTSFADQPDGKPTTASDLLCQILSGVHYTKEQVETFLVQNTGKLAPIYVPVVLSKVTESACCLELETAISDIPDSYAFKFDGHYVILLGASKPAEHSEQFLSTLRRFGIQAATGRPCDDLSQLRTYYRQAVDTLNYMKVLRSDTEFCSYDQFCMIRLLDGLRDDVDLNNFLISDVRVLHQYDIENQTELCKTLLCYLENSKNTSLTAKVMHIHRNSVYYRIDKCMEMLPNIDFNDGVMSFLVMLSLYIAQYDYYVTHR